MNKVTHFEIVATDPLRAVDFYTKVFGWEIKKWEDSNIGMDYWMVMTVPQGTPGAINGGLRKEMGTDIKEMTKSVNGFVCTVVVEDIDGILEKVTSNGGKIMQPKNLIPTVGWLAYCLDTEGNMFGVMLPEM